MCTRRRRIFFFNLNQTSHRLLLHNRFQFWEVSLNSYFIAVHLSICYWKKIIAYDSFFMLKDKLDFGIVGYYQGKYHNRDSLLAKKNFTNLTKISNEVTFTKISSFLFLCKEFITLWLVTIHKTIEQKITQYIVWIMSVYKNK